MRQVRRTSKLVSVQTFTTGLRHADVDVFSKDMKRKSRAASVER